MTEANPNLASSHPRFLPFSLNETQGERVEESTFLFKGRLWDDMVDVHWTLGTGQKHWMRCFTCLCSLESHMPPFYKWERWGSESLNDLLVHVEVPESDQGLSPCTAHALSLHFTVSLHPVLQPRQPVPGHCRNIFRSSSCKDVPCGFKGSTWLVLLLKH